MCEMQSNAANEAAISDACAAQGPRKRCLHCTKRLQRIAIEIAGKRKIYYVQRQVPLSHPSIEACNH